MTAEMRPFPACQGLNDVGPGKEVDLRQCHREGVRWVAVTGCGCPDPDHEVCLPDFRVWVCEVCAAFHRDVTDIKSSV